MRYSLLFCAALLTTNLANAQSNRRERQDPELIVETGGRLAYCDQMLFTADGKWVLTAGDDKVVRLWECRDGQLDPASMRVLRWNIWREFRGAIYALAISPDPESRYIAIGGVGELTTTVAVLDRITGDIKHYGVPYVDRETGAIVPAADLAKHKLRNLFAVHSLAFAPSGTKVAFGTADGSVFLWDFKKFRPIGRHDAEFGGRTVPDNTPILKDGFNRVRLVRFLAEDRLLSVAESSEVVEWDLSTSPAQRSREWLVGSGYSVRVATATADNRWLAFGLKGPVVAVRSLNGKINKDIALSERQFTRSVAFDAAGQTLAIGIGFIPLKSKFYMETDERVRLVSLSDSKDILMLRKSGRAESLAFHPDGNLLAVAGGNNHEVTLWNLAKSAAPVSVMRGSGTCLWDVGLSADGNVLGFKDRRNNVSLDPNNRGEGAWRAFELPRRRWVSGDDFKPVQRLETVDGWRVKPSATDPYVWYAVSRSGEEYPLEYDGAREGMPRCYSFIEGDGDNPPRLAVGHYWGLSIYELRGDKRPKRVRLCVGHQGEVTALGVSADGTWLVSASNDQTIAAWTLSNRWPSQPILGAAFEPDGVKLRVTAVDTGSPAWEAGLLVGDEIVRFGFAGAWMTEKRPDVWLQQLKNPVPGKEHYFQVLRGGKIVNMLTTARQRPLWRFFPTRDNRDWVLWMWRNPYYDTSTKGDSAIGWHVNSPEVGKKPTFYRAEQFRKIYHKPTVIDKLLLTRDVRTALKVFAESNRLPKRFDATEPPAVSIALTAVPGGWEAKLTATPHGINPDLMPGKGELWVNDFRLQRWDDVSTWAKEGTQYVQKVPVPATVLRAGDNVLTFQTSNRLDGRAETSTTVSNPKAAPARPRLLGMVVGINDYHASKPPRGSRDLGNLLSAVNDARSIQAAWEAQKYFQSVEIKSLLNAQADNVEIVKALDELARKATPDDLCVIFLAGHGMYREVGTTDETQSLFIFCCPRFEGESPEKTGLTSEVLHAKLAAINCRKLVLLDACHSGQAASNPVRVLTPSNQGPVILAACDRNQHSFEHTFADQKTGHGLFTRAVLEALGDNFAQADSDANRKLDTRELYTYALGRLPQLLTDIKQNDKLQVPIMFAPQERPFIVTER